MPSTPTNTRDARRFLLSLLIAANLLLGCRSPGQVENASWPRHKLKATKQWLLNSPNRIRFDASGLIKLPDGSLLTVNDRGPQLYRIELDKPDHEATLVRHPGCFSSIPWPSLNTDRPSHLDCEGLALDEAGRIYLCEESNRWILRCQPGLAMTERLAIDWSSVSSYFSKSDPNASLEGVAVAKGRLYVANERSDPVILVVDLAELKVIDHFTVYPKAWSLFGTHYSDLAWHEGRLFVLLRQHRVILEVDPDRKTVLAEYDYQDLEDRLDYHKSLPVGIMEGLAVDDEFFWLVTDNNGWARGSGQDRDKDKDSRPALLQCPRPSIPTK